MDHRCNFCGGSFPHPGPHLVRRRNMWICSTCYSDGTARRVTGVGPVKPVVQKPVKPAKPPEVVKPEPTMDVPRMVVVGEPILTEEDDLF
jgi:hypothetical protein